MPLRRYLSALAVPLATALVATLPAMASPTAPPHWVATWHASPQAVWSVDFLFPAHIPARLQAQTVRHVARISLGGTRLRLAVSNLGGTQPLVVGRATVARPAGDPAAGRLEQATLRQVTFDGQPTARIAPGATLTSDPVALPLANLDAVAISFYLPEATPLHSFHWDGRQTSWIAPGDQSAQANLTGTPQATTARVLLTGIEVEAPASAASVAVLGDSITDGAMASLDRDTRWPDYLARRLAPRGLAAVNAGISGARLLSDGVGERALGRLERDALALPGVTQLIVLLGINDIAWPGTAFAPNATRPTLEALIAGYRALIAKVHAKGVRVTGATLTPFAGALPGTPLADYYQPEKEQLRQRLNAWIRTAGAFDEALDLDQALRDPAQPSQLAPAYDSGDHLHPGDAGNRAMAEAVNLDNLAAARRIGGR